MTLEVENPEKYNSDPFWEKQGEDSGICLLRIIGFALEQIIILADEIFTDCRL